MTQTTQQFPRASFFKRIAAMIYDILVAVAIGMCAGLIYSVIGLLLFETGTINSQGFSHFMDFSAQSNWFKIIGQLWVGFWILVFFLWFWRNGGQTIGMRAWRLRLFSTTDEPLTYGRALMRIIFSIGGLGTLLVLFDFKNKQSLQDRLAKTEMLTLSKEANHHRAWKSL